MDRPHTDDTVSRSAGPSECNALHAGGSQHTAQPGIDPTSAIPKSGGVPGSPSSSFKDLTPTNFPPAHESRRRNAEQRAATLRADALVGEVEPNRVFCTLCKKWVQLRQDSSYCAYPWLQHRGKCLARQWVISFNLYPCMSHTSGPFFPLFAVQSLMVRGGLVGYLLGFSERRAQKAAQAADARAKGGQPAVEDSLTDDDASAEDELESDNGHADGPESNRTEERPRLKAPLPTEPRVPPLSAKKHRLVDSADNRLGPPWSATSDATTSGGTFRKVPPTRAIRPKSKHEADGAATVELGTSANRLPRRLILGLADLDSVYGRYVILFIRFLRVQCPFDVLLFQ